MTLNMDVLLLSAVLASLVILGALGAATGMFASGDKESRARLAKMKARFSDKTVLSGSAASIRRGTTETGLLGKLDSLLPRRAELEKRLLRAGLKVSLAKYAAFVMGFMLVMVTVFLMTGTAPMLAVSGGLAVGLGLPVMFINMRIKGRLATFTKQFPDAIDMIVRGLKSGLPVSECITHVGHEMSAPTGDEFLQITDQRRLGKTLEAALWDTAERLDTPDFKFFVISLSVQRETGGNLGETLGNLSAILRQRQAMKLKVSALSSEAKASAWIVGLLPVVMLGLIMLSNPAYGMVLFTNPQATTILIGAAMWMGLGIFIMARMTNFEI